MALLGNLNDIKFKWLMLKNADDDKLEAEGRAVESQLQAARQKADEWRRKAKKARRAGL